jgi:hypothetical protein
MVNKADLNSPALTGTPTAPTAAAGTNTNQIATTAFVLANSLGAMYRTRVALAAATVPVTEKVVACLGYASPGDCDVFLLTRVAPQPDYGGVRSAGFTFRPPLALMPAHSATRPTGRTATPAQRTML